MSEILLFQSVDDGEIDIINGDIKQLGGLETATYLSLFGGNEDDSGRDKDPTAWWGNITETQKAYKQRSETQYLLRSLPQTSNNLLRIEDAAKRDLDWMLEEKVASNIGVIASIPALNKIKLVINVDNQTLNFIENWRAK
ncbi:phage GP46 family protein [Francisella philomiragia]|uniref:Phage GP46 family protein n=1 Tax=Francisella philomiragia TaxID=28110 RepID=A0ABS1GCD0_9GAMM|nr:phage GP46 family protein [Francisella philomiragia]MBK2258741.1 phage GP46 family protein [Francisella philomiragia]MBK2302432.1 phage GP46 family protein [Francisella philomiragia]